MRQIKSAENLSSVTSTNVTAVMHYEDADIRAMTVFVQ